MIHECYKMEASCRKEEGARKLLAKEKDGSRQGHLPREGGGGKSKGSYHADYLIFLWGMEGTPVGMTSVVLTGKVLTDPVKTVFLEEVETIIQLGIKPLFGDLA